MEKRSHKYYLELYEIFGNELGCRIDPNHFPFLHDHDFWEIMVVFEGSCSQILNGQELIMHQHSALLLHPSDAHMLLGNPADRHLNIMINCEFMREMCDFFDSSLYEKLLSTPATPFSLSASQVKSLLDIVRELQLYPLNQFPRRLKRMLISLFLDLYQLQFDMKSVDYPPALQKLFEVLSRPDSVNMEVNDLVALTGYSYSHFAKLFKAYTGISANEYLMEKKMGYAGYALLHLNVPVSQLAIDLGYQSLSYFTHLFKKYYGVSPMQYKKSVWQ